jgi:hypothetical protein
MPDGPQNTTALEIVRERCNRLNSRSEMTTLMSCATVSLSAIV